MASPLRAISPKHPTLKGHTQHAVQHASAEFVLPTLPWLTLYAHFCYLHGHASTVTGCAATATAAATSFTTAATAAASSGRPHCSCRHHHRCCCHHRHRRGSGSSCGSSRHLLPPPLSGCASPTSPTSPCPWNMTSPQRSQNPPGPTAAAAAVLEILELRERFFCQKPARSDPQGAPPRWSEPLRSPLPPGRFRRIRRQIQESSKATAWWTSAIRCLARTFAVILKKRQFLRGITQKSLPGVDVPNVTRKK